ncbi:Deoxycytidine monophosphate (dCMP) deaminase [Mortierella claussenii]|nr:Deoxycytidine monophosphate (dCMP) deaminase [Mortierella claussenii]
MFIGIVGPTCSGKHEIMNLLASSYGFTRLFLTTTSPVGGAGLKTHNGHNSNIARGISNIHTNHTVLNGRRSSRSCRRPEDQEFATLEAMLYYVTLNWMGHFVTCDIHTVQGISVLRKRPFFLLLSVESPMMMRYRRCIARSQKQGLEAPTLEEFVTMTDNSLYTTPMQSTPTLSSTASFSGLSTRSPDIELDLEEISTPTIMTLPALDDPSEPVSFLPSTLTSTSTSTPAITATTPSFTQFFNSPSYKLLSMSDLCLLNDHTDLISLQHSLDALDITNPDLLRPSWDSYFMYLANLAARRSNCMKRRVGCVLVRDKRVIATGYNGTPKNLTNCNDGGCSRCNQAAACGQGLDRCLCMHAEENALLEAGRERVGNGSTIYCNTCPCLGCAIKIVQVGVSQVVYSESYGMDELTAEVFRKAGVELRQHATPGIKLAQSEP